MTTTMRQLDGGRGVEMEDAEDDGRSLGCSRRRSGRHGGVLKCSPLPAGDDGRPQGAANRGGCARKGERGRCARWCVGVHDGVVLAAHGKGGDHELWAAMLGCWRAAHCEVLDAAALWVEGKGLNRCSRERGFCRPDAIVMMGVV